MKYRMANVQDIEQLVHMRIKFIEEQTKRVTSEQKNQIESNLPEYYKRHLNEDMFAFVVEENNQIIATAYLLVNEKPANTVFPLGRVGEVLSVYTDKEYRCQGIARRLMELLVAKGKEEKLDYIELEATEAGYPVYKSIGFEETSSNYVSMRLTYN